MTIKEFDSLIPDQTIYFARPILDCLLPEAPANPVGMAKIKTTHCEHESVRYIEIKGGAWIKLEECFTDRYAAAERFRDRAGRLIARVKKIADNA